MLKKSQFESLILCKDRDFKHRSVNFLNGIAFNSEKHTCENPVEACAAIEGNPKILNVIIDGTDFSALLDEEELTALNSICKRPELMAVLYLPENKVDSLKKEHGIKNLFVFPLPFEKSQFNLVFHSRGNKDQGPSSPSGPLSVFQGSKKPAPPKKPEIKKDVIAFETSGHIKDSLAMIKIVEQNREATDQVVKAGQMFNGMVGALAYFENKKGYKELKNLATAVDEVSRFYEDKKHPKISDEHFRIFYHSAINSFKLLQAMRDNKPIDEKLLSDSADLFNDYSGLEEFQGKKSCDQDEIDKILDKSS